MFPLIQSVYQSGKLAKAGDKMKEVCDKMSYTV